ncbi:PLP-dependent aminotransferase family protein [Cryptosporangium aurantiacum]|uniref:GntR family transcriptional regulator / MocR family aminotransferase n=1 Tax=Cryptosporangium aurantiacum TaxID=134849 RepID=A0A1M7Q4I4_9ACTN|nr:PLP-dependent aminotransferase family protein [Cryptosporangium aurantiacum]SHN25254.1 GntR family transcriptional regulator / MocR family aminotransferase [Cryptosporangium aurantiacum]
MSSGSDFLQLRAASAPTKGLTTWLVDAVRAAVADGRLVAGARLPATRVLATDLGVSRGVVVEAYQRLVDEGLAQARTGVGTVITTLLTPPAPGPAGAGPATPGPATPDPAEVAPGPAAPGSAEAVPGPGAVGGPPDRAGASTPTGFRLPLGPAAGIEFDLSPGRPDLAAFPRAAWLRAERTVLATMTSTDLGYGDPRGTLPLRTELAAWLARTRGTRADPDDVVVVAGVAQALALVARILGAGRAVAIEDPGSRGARDQLIHWGMHLHPVPVDGDGLRIDALAATGAPIVLLTPAHQFPTGVVLAPQRRRELLGWADAHGGLILEDDYDAEHRYDRAPVAALQASAADRVVYMGSTSKTLAPGMRLGWMVAPRAMRDHLIAAKHATDLGNPALSQLVLAHLLASGEYERHLRRVRVRQRRRRDALHAALTRHLPDARVEGVAAGLHLLISLPGDVPDTVLAEKVAEVGVRVHPLSWHRMVPGPPGLVIGYAAHPPNRLEEAARRMGAGLAAVVRSTTAR